MYKLNSMDIITIMTQPVGPHFCFNRTLVSVLSLFQCWTEPRTHHFLINSSNYLKKTPWKKTHLCQYLPLWLAYRDRINRLTHHYSAFVSAPSTPLPLSEMIPGGMKREKLVQKSCPSVKMSQKSRITQTQTTSLISTFTYTWSWAEIPAL